MTEAISTTSSICPHSPPDDGSSLPLYVDESHSKAAIVYNVLIALRQSNTPCLLNIFLALSPSNTSPLSLSLFCLITAPTLDLERNTQKREYKMIIHFVCYLGVVGVLKEDI